MSQLSRLRGFAAEGDKNLPVFRPTIPRYERPKGSRYVTLAGKPQDLEALRMYAEPYGDAAVRRACFSAVTTWALFNAITGLLTHGYTASSDAIRLCSKEDEALGFPDFNISGMPPALPLMPQDEQDRIRTVAADTKADWVKAGSPGMVRAIKQSHGHVLAYKTKIKSKDTVNVRV